MHFDRYAEVILHGKKKGHFIKNIIKLINLYLSTNLYES